MATVAMEFETRKNGPYFRMKLTDTRTDHFWLEYPRCVVLLIINTYIEVSRYGTPNCRYILYVILYLKL